MTTSPAAQLLGDLARDDIHLWLDGSSLRYRSPPHALTPGRKAAIQSLKSELIELLRAQERAPPRIEGAEAVWDPTEMQVGMIRNKSMPNLLVAFRWHGKLDLDVFPEALELLQWRHAILRTRFIEDPSGRTWAVTEPRLRIDALVVDMRVARDEAGSAEAVGSLRALNDSVFDLSTGAGLRAAVVIHTDEDSAFLFAAHHAVFDAFSTRILIRDFSALYTALVKGEAAELPPLTVQYGDFAIAQHRLLEGAGGPRSLSYWRRALTGAKDIFRLPYDRHSPVGNTAQLPLVKSRLPDTVSDALRAVAKQAQSTLYIAATAALAVVIARWTHSRDVSFWISEHGRRRPELLELIGCLISIWPIHLDLTGSPRFSETLRNVHTVYTSSLRHAHVPLGRLKPELDRVRNGQVYPGLVFNFVPSNAFDWTREVAAPGDGHGLTGRFPADHFIAVRLTMIDSPGGLEWYFEHSSHMFEEATIERLSEDLARTLTELSRGDDSAWMPVAATSSPSEIAARNTPTA